MPCKVTAGRFWLPLRERALTVHGEWAMSGSRRITGGVRRRCSWPAGPRRGWQQFRDLSRKERHIPIARFRVVVPFAAGGPSDIIARIVADALYPQLGQTLVIDNRAGGGANIGIGQAARAEPDGYTLLITTSAFVINPSLYKKIPFDPIKDFSPISDLAISPQMLSVMPGYVNTLAEFIAKAKAAPGKLNYSSPGAGTQAQLTVELLKLRAGIDIVHVPFTGGPPAVQALLSGSVQLTTNAVPTSEKLAQAGTIQPLAVSGKARYFALPNVPTLVESGFPGFVTDTLLDSSRPPERRSRSSSGSPARRARC